MLKLKVDALESLEQRARNAAREGDDLRKRLAEYENKVALLAQENERIRSNLQLNSQLELDTARRKLQDQDRKIAELETAARESEVRFRTFDNQTRTYEQQIRSTYQETETIRGEASRRYGEYENKIVVLSKEIERLNELL